jgi:molybdopterin converting factor small subunit
METMTVYVKLFAQLRKYHPGPNRSQAIALSLPEHAIAADLVAALNLPAPLVRTPFINNVKAELAAELHDGDHISLFSPVVGGD